MFFSDPNLVIWIPQNLFGWLKIPVLDGRFGSFREGGGVSENLGPPKKLFGLSTLSFGWSNLV